MNQLEKTIKNTPFITVLVIWALVSACGAQAKPAKQPNILFILSDDAGYADFGFQGSKEMLTPRLDQLAKESLRFDQAYVSAAVCGPSRAGILTGRYQQKFGYEENNVPGYMSTSGTTGDDMGLPLDESTMGNHLQSIGYETILIGKWHLGNADKFHPLKRGFDQFYGFRGGARSYWAFNEGNPNQRPEDFLERGYKIFAESDKYFTDLLADETIAQMKQARDKPFFIFLSLTAVHAPMDAEEKDLAEFPLLQGTRKKLAAMNLSMDRNIGRVLDALEQSGLDKNTIVIYTNDNGGPTDQNASDNAPLSGSKANHLEGGIRVPFLLRWPGVTKGNTRYPHPISTLDLLPTFYTAGNGKESDLNDIDGVDLRPYITGKNKAQPHKNLYWKKETRAAIREGDWKLLRFPDRPAELYDIKNDIAEQNNLAATQPELVKSLYKKLFQWELTLERPRWQLKREYEGAAMKRMDKYRKNE